MSDNRPIISLVPLQEDDKEHFILDNQWAFRYGAQIEFGMRDDRAEEGEEVISRRTIERCMDGENAASYRIVQDGKHVGGMVLNIDQNAGKGELELLFVSPEVHGHGIGKAAWQAVAATSTSSSGRLAACSPNRARAWSTWHRSTMAIR